MEDGRLGLEEFDAVAIVGAATRIRVGVASRSRLVRRRRGPEGGREAERDASQVDVLQAASDTLMQLTLLQGDTVHPIESEAELLLVDLWCRPHVGQSRSPRARRCAWEQRTGSTRVENTRSRA